MLKKILACALLCFALWLAGLLWFAAQIPTAPSADDRPSDAIVVLTGAAGRLDYGLQLFAQGKAPVLYVSGVSGGITVADLLRQEPQALRDDITKLPHPTIMLGHKAENTIGNAEETARWLRSRHYKSIRLVTSNYHMPRSVSEFEEALPDIAIIPEPVFSDEFPAAWWQSDVSRRLLLSEYHKYIAARLRHWMLSARRRT